jgi:hypothetical protein
LSHRVNIVPLIIKEKGCAYSRERVKGNGLEANEVRAAWDRRGDGGGPGVVLGDHQTRTPTAGVDGSGQKTGLVDLEL